MREDKWETRKNLLLLLAYQVANLTMLIGFFLALFVLAQSLGLFEVL